MLKKQRLPVWQLQLCPAAQGTRRLQRWLGTASPQHSDSCLWKPGAARRACGLSCLSQKISITCDISPKEIRSVPELISCLYFMRLNSEEHLMKELQSWGRTDVLAALLGSASCASSLCSGKICQTGLITVSNLQLVLHSHCSPFGLWTSLSYQYLAFNLYINVLRDSQVSWHCLTSPVSMLLVPFSVSSFIEFGFFLVNLIMTRIREHYFCSRTAMICKVSFLEQDTLVNVVYLSLDLVGI